MFNTPTKEMLDKVPELYHSEKASIKDAEIHLHFFILSTDWFVAEYDGKDLFFGFTILNGDYEMAEWGYFSFNELKEISVGIGAAILEVDCQTAWRVRSAAEVEKIVKAQGW